MRHSSTRGFSLIELMVAVAVLAILLAVAIPSFNDFRQRAALRGAVDQMVSFWGDARFEAVRRNSLVKVGVVTKATGEYCIGAATTTIPGDDSACDCFTAAACNVGQFPADQGEWRSIRLLGSPAWGGSDADLQGVAVINPKRGNITESADADSVSLGSPANSGVNYRLNVAIDRNGRAVVCEPDTATSKMPQYADRPCKS